MSERAGRGRRDRRRRPVLAVAATAGTIDRLRPLVRQLATRVDLWPLDRTDGDPDGVLATSVSALSVVRSVAPADLPVAVWVDDAVELAHLAASPPFFEGKLRHDAYSLQKTMLLGAGAGTDVRVALSADRGAVVAGAIAVPPDALDVRGCPVLPPLVRARLRQRHGLPALFVVAVGPDADPADDAITSLALAAAAVVTGPLLATALSLGTPLVSTKAEADRLAWLGGTGAVELAEPDSLRDRDELARTIAADGTWAARASLAARRFAEAALDVNRIADLLLDRLGLSDSDAGSDGSEASTHVDAYLAELMTPPTAPVRARADLAIASFFSADRS